MTADDDSIDPDESKDIEGQRANDTGSSLADFLEQYARRTAEPSEQVIPGGRGAEGDSSGFDTIDRERGVLTRADRAFLLGRKEFENRQTYTDTRRRIRERITNALLDFGLLALHLDPGQRQKVFEAFDEASLEWSLRRVSQFLYAGLDHDAEEFANLLEDGIFQAELFRAHADAWISGEIRDVDVSIDLDHAPDADKLYDRYQNGEPLTDSELGALVRSDKLSKDDYALLPDYQRLAGHPMFTPGLWKQIQESDRSRGEPGSAEINLDVLREHEEEGNSDGV